MCFQSKEFELLPSISAPSYVLSRIPTFTKIMPTTRKRQKNTTNRRRKQKYVLTSLPLQAVLDNNLVVVQLLLRHGAQIDQKVTDEEDYDDDDGHNGDKNC